MSAFFSGDPLPIAPRLENGEGESLEQNFVELERFNDKLLEYLRRLGLHLSNPDVVTSPSSSVKTFAASLTTDTAFTSDTGGNVLPWDLNLRIDDAFAHSTTVSPAEITLVSGGLFLCHYDIGTASTGDQTWLTIDDTIIPWSYSDPVLERLYVSNVTFHANPNQVLKCWSDSTSDALEARSRVTILKLGAIAAVPGDGGGDCNDEPWLLCP